MVTYKDAAQVVRYRCVNQQAKKVDLRAIILLLAVKTNLFRALIVWIINKQTQIELIKLTN